MKITESLVDYLAWTIFDLHNEKRISREFVLVWFVFVTVLGLVVIGAGYLLFYLIAMLRVLSIYL